MQQVNLFELLSLSSAEIVVSAVAACVLSKIFQKVFKASSKIFILVSFILGTVLCGGYYTLKCGLNEIYITNSLTAGGISSALMAFIAKINSKSALKKVLDELLSNILLEDRLNSVVTEIMKTLKKGVSQATLSELKKIIEANRREEVNEQDLDNLCEFILSALPKGSPKTK